jgi:hypothetical protein
MKTRVMMTLVFNMCLSFTYCSMNNMVTRGGIVVSASLSSLVQLANLNLRSEEQIISPFGRIWIAVSPIVFKM